MPVGMQFNSAIPTPTMPRSGYGAPQIDYSRLGGLSPYNAVQSLMTSGLSPEQAYSAYQTWSQTGQGPQTSWAPMGAQYGQQSGRLQIGAAPAPGGGGSGLPPQSGPLPAQSGTPRPAGGFQQGPLNTPYNMSPFYLDPGANPGAGGGAVPSGDAGGKIEPPRVANPMIPPQMNPMQLGGGPPPGSTPAEGRGGYASSQGAGLPSWHTGEAGQSREEAGYNFLMAQGMDEVTARQRSGWTGAAGMTAAASQSRHGVDAFNSANTARLAAARPAYEAARARENPAPTAVPSGGVSHSGGALLPQYQPPKPQYPTPGYTGIAGGQGNSINTFGTPGKGAQLTSYGYRYAA